MECICDHALRTKRMTMPTATIEHKTLPSHDDVLAAMAQAEQADGWLAVCEQAGRYLTLTRELVDALERQLQSLGDRPVLEVCAGRGELAATLTDQGVSIIATDGASNGDGSVIQLDATEALDVYQPAVVLGSFVPFDADVDQAVLACRSVQRYVVLNARIGGQLGHPDLWRCADWCAQPLDEVSRWMITRHDVWVGRTRRPFITHGEAWQLSRRIKS